MLQSFGVNKKLVLMCELCGSDISFIWYNILFTSRLQCPVRWVKIAPIDNISLYVGRRS